MSASPHIVITLHCAGGLRSDVFARLAGVLPVESMNSGFSELVLVLPISAVLAAKDFIAQAERVRVSDPAYRHLQIGLSRAILPQPLPQPMPQEHPAVIEAFKCGLSSSSYSDELERLEHELA
jgi:hypothetical protein